MDFPLDMAEYKLGHDFNRFFGTPASLLNEIGITDLKKSDEDIIQYTILNQIWGRFGYISIASFIPNMGNYYKAVDIMRGLLVKELKDTDGLIIDVRNNPGGSIQMAEG
jgi:C-terminal processing protease CtpA/Prc